MTLLRLRVLSGPNAGASMEVRQQTLRIGSDPQQNDLILLDPSVQPHHLQIHVDEAHQVTVTAAQDATLQINDETFSAGQTCVLPEAAVVRVGQSELLVDCSDQLLPGPLQTDPMAQPHTQEPTTEAPALPPKPRYWRMLGAAAATMGMLLAGALMHDSTLLQLGKTQPAARSAQVDATRPLLWDPLLQTRPTTPATQGLGTVLYETRKAAPSPPAAAKTPQRLLLARVVATRDGPQMLETTSGQEYTLSTDPLRGYELFLASANRMVLHKGQEVVEIFME